MGWRHKSMSNCSLVVGATVYSLGSDGLVSGDISPEHSKLMAAHPDFARVAEPEKAKPAPVAAPAPPIKPAKAAAKKKAQAPKKKKKTSSKWKRTKGE